MSKIQKIYYIVLLHLLLLPGLFPGYLQAQNNIRMNPLTPDSNESVANLLPGGQEWVNTGFGKIHKDEIVNAVSVLDVTDIMAYDNVLSLTEAMNSRLTGLTSQRLMRGIGTPTYVIDGLPRDAGLLGLINVSDIEKIILLKDVNAAMLFGNTASSGIVIITTKRGSMLKNSINVSAHYGLAQPRAFPQYLSSADYMEQYNIARSNDGLTPFYDRETIENYRFGNPYRYPSIDYYSSDYLKKVKPYSTVLLNMSGGNKIGAYYAGLRWDREDNLLNFGAGKSSKINNFQATGNVDMNVNKYINTSIDAAGYIGFNQQSQGNYWNAAASLRPDRYSPLIPIELIDPSLEELLQARKRDIDGVYLAGGNSDILSNPVTDVYLAGQTSRIVRDLSFSNRIDIDLGKLTEGLAFHTNISFNYYNTYSQSIANNYAVYEPFWDPEQDKIIGLSKFGEDRRTGVQYVSYGAGWRRIGGYAMFDYNRTFANLHHVGAVLTGYANYIKNSANIQATKNANLGLRLRYSYNNKYIADFNNALVTSAKLHPNNRIGLSPSLGLGWIVSSEEFMPETSFLNHLKLKISGGMMRTDTRLDYFLYDNYFTSVGNFSWYEGSKSRDGIGTAFSGNKNISFEKRNSLNFGIESILFDRSLSFEANYFVEIHSDLATKVNTLYPSYYSNFAPYGNFNKNAYRGFELGLSYQRKWGNFGFATGFNILYATSEVLQRDEIYDNDYQYRKGNPVTAIYGLVDNGFYTGENDINTSSISAFGAVQPGDIKYIDQNNDKLINANDERMIGNSMPPFSFGFNLKLSYKNVSLFTRIAGCSGADGYLGDYGSYYLAQGDSKYSSYMLNHWMESTRNTATYPRLSTQADDNNFRISSFWLYDASYCNIERIQVTYDVPIKQNNKLFLKALSFFINASNCLTIAPNKDILLLNIGSEPQYRTFAVGLKTSF
jgi:TonB-linked SusC/RagA family outer membrane protein